MRRTALTFFAAVALSGWLGSQGLTRAETVNLPDDSLTSGIPGNGPLKMGEIEKFFSNPKNHEVLDVLLPLGLSAGQGQVVGLEENPLTRAKIELGRQLYFDTRLSADNTISCASCHHPDDGFSRKTQFGVGIQGQEGNRNSPVSYNRILSSLQFWDGRAGSVEEQAKGPIQNPIEMGNTHDVCVQTIRDIPGYVKEFTSVFGPDSVNIDNIAKAIAAFERVIVTGPSPYDYADRWARYSRLDAEELKEDDPDLYEAYEDAKKTAEKHPMSESAKRGQALFFSQRVNCSACHVGPNLADEKYHNLGVGMDKKDPDVGRYAVTKKDEDWGAFKTPTIRNVEFSAPYMHDGSLATLMDVVEHYDKGGIPNKNLSNKIEKLNLKQQEKEDLVAFMKACTGPFPKVATGRLPANP